MRRRIQPPTERVALIGCGKSKLPRSAPARALYAPPKSLLFKASLEVAEKQHQHVHVLSAKYGLVKLEQVLEPYELSIRQLTPEQQDEWGLAVVRALAAQHPGRLLELHAYASKPYLVPIRRHLPSGWTVVEPMRGLEQGERLGWLKRERARLRADPMPSKVEQAEALVAGFVGRISFNGPFRAYIRTVGLNSLGTKTARGGEVRWVVPGDQPPEGFKEQACAVDWLLLRCPDTSYFAHEIRGVASVRIPEDELPDYVMVEIDVPEMADPAYLVPQCVFCFRGEPEHCTGKAVRRNKERSLLPCTRVQTATIAAGAAQIGGVRVHPDTPGAQPVSFEEPMLLLKDEDFLSGQKDQTKCYVCGKPAVATPKDGLTVDGLGTAHNFCLTGLGKELTRKREKLLEEISRAKSPEFNPARRAALALAKVLGDGKWHSFEELRAIAGEHFFQATAWGETMPPHSWQVPIYCVAGEGGGQYVLWGSEAMRQEVETRKLNERLQPQRSSKTFVSRLAAPVRNDFPCCGGSDEDPPECTQDCITRQSTRVDSKEEP